MILIQKVTKIIEGEGCYSRVALHQHLITKTNAHLRVQWCKKPKGRDVGGGENHTVKSLFEQVDESPSGLHQDKHTDDCFAVEGIFYWHIVLN